MPVEVQHELLRFSRLDSTKLLSDPSQQLAYGYVAGNALSWNDQMGLGRWQDTKDAVKKAVSSVGRAVRSIGRGIKKRANRAKKSVSKFFSVKEKGYMLYPAFGSDNLEDYPVLATNGILAKEQHMQEFSNLHNIPVYYNPSKGVIRDIWQSFLQKINGGNDNLAKGLAEELEGVESKKVLLAHSQGTITSKNSGLFYDMENISHQIYKSPAAFKANAEEAAKKIGSTLRYDLPVGDISNLLAPSLNPARIVSSVLDVSCLTCIHKSNNLEEAYREYQQWGY